MPQPHPTSGAGTPSWQSYSALMAAALEGADLDLYRRLSSARSALAEREADERRRRAIGGLPHGRG
ncbi:hypothetical protein ACFXKF_36575 [Streptomyces scopuliridis]|uniref:hypothetical protein n=1 Tax=Streptomyces scopuliridis TaxID=452529 RepID=UPI00368725B2